jgi:hypothetical protein
VFLRLPERGASGSVRRGPANPARPGREQRYRERLGRRRSPEVPRTSENQVHSQQFTVTSLSVLFATSHSTIPFLLLRTTDHRTRITHSPQISSSTSGTGRSMCLWQSPLRPSTFNRRLLTEIFFHNLKLFRCVAACETLFHELSSHREKMAPANF